jgi:hypothetical protein
MRLNTAIRAAAAAAIAAGVGLIASGGAASASPSFGPQTGHALFLETDAASGNQILSYQRGPDGTISFVRSYSTGGVGATASGATADPLASEGGLALINNGSELVATNAGSDTISVFAVFGTQLFLVQQLSSDGLFPCSVTSHGNLVTVLNAGGAGSIAQFQEFGGFLAPQSAQVRSLGLSNTNPPDFHHGAGQVSYTPSGSQLIVTTKLSTNAFDVFSVAPNGSLGATPVVSAANNALPFGFTFDSKGNVVATEASNSSVSVYRVGANGALTSLGTVSDGAAALCWIVGANGTFYGDNAGSGTVSSFDENSSGAPVLVNATAATAHAGTTDSTISPDGRYLYVESGGAGTVDVYGIGSGGSLTQIETVFNVPVASEGIAVS